jgi:hypothetical protein
LHIHDIRLADQGNVGLPGFHQQSMKNTTLALTKFNPTPPACNDINKTVYEGSSRNCRKVFSLCGCVIEPSKRRNLNFCCFNGISI